MCANSLMMACTCGQVWGRGPCWRCLKAVALTWQDSPLITRRAVVRQAFDAYASRERIDWVCEWPGQVSRRSLPTHL